VDNITKLLENYMFSNLAQITAKPRHAENADTRHDIRRHDPEQEHRSKKEKGEGHSTFDTYDNAVVSIDALRMFLENFLKSLTTGSAGENMNLPAQGFNAGNDNPEAPETPRPVDAQASRAASIYQTGAKTAPRTHMPVGKAPEQGPAIENEDVRRIHGLLRDTAVLLSRGIEYLTIEQRETFLDSLAAAVTKALNS
jgi:hypothetical protein